MNRPLGLALAFRLLTVAPAIGAENQPPATAPADVRFGPLPDTNTVFKPAEYNTLEEWKARRAWLQEQVRVATGLWPEPARTPLNAKIFDKRDYDGVTIEKVHFESRPGLYVFGNLYRPAKIEGKIPAIACAIGHWAHQRLQQDDNADYSAMGRMLARLGFTALVYDMTGYNEGARQMKHGINTPARDLWGITSLGLQTWNSTRVIDFLQSLPEVDPERIGMTGASGGGTQTFILYSIDDRIKAAVPVNMISSTMQGGCVCENAPCLRIDTNNMEIGAMMAPRPMLMISASGDWTAKTPEVEFPFIRSIYALYGAADKVSNAHFDAPHNYHKASREAMYAFFAKTLLGRSDVGKITEPDLPKIDPKELMVWTDETAPKDLLNIEQLKAALVNEVSDRVAGLRPDSKEKLTELTSLVQHGLQFIVASDFPTDRTPSSGRLTLESARSTPQILPRTIGERQKKGESEVSEYTLTRKERTIRLRRVFRDTTATPSAPALRIALIIHRAGAEAQSELRDGLLDQAEGERYLATFPEVFGAGSVPPSHPPKSARGSSSFFTTFNRVDAAETAFDILTVMAYAHRFSSIPQLRARDFISFGEFGPRSLIARAMIPPDAVTSMKLRTVIDMNRFDIYSDDAYLKELNVPHIRRIGGLRAIAAVACNGPIWFHNVGEHFDEEWVKAAGRVNGVEVRVTREKADEKAIAEWLAKNN